ncbi:hypothetical protein H6G96_12480 [Nostoc sp. FACHB-892]|uniref:hypothetical protein n=1 Tax=Nostoc sp. FACHB-892 TaxID=2692843 RepID=UPI001686C2BA|nr:hypothetical protein [Nostoc sp. FACHB-892]MBD2727127.1 hypothetical protein [Nostoc sp. FACHB-892]
MSKIIYDVIQRFEVENGVPRLISTNIQVIEGGEDLMSLATSLLDKLGFYNKFQEKRTSQYIGYKLKNPGKGAKRYQLVFAQRKEGLSISIPQEILEPYLLKLNFSINFFTKMPELENVVTMFHEISKFYWIIPSKKNIFFDLSKEYRETFKGQIIGDFELNFDGIAYKEAKNAYSDSKIQNINDMQLVDIIQNKYINKHPLSNSLDNSDCCLNIGKGDIGKDKLFNYAYQVAINSKEVLEEFIIYFAKILMEQQ